MQKEILTREIIKKEFIYQELYGRKETFILLIVLLPLLCLILSLFSDRTWANIVLAIPTSLLALLIFICLHIFYESFKLCRLMKKDKFYITKDNLIRTRGKSIGGYTGHAYTLHFASYGEYALGAEKYYKWSKLYSMSDEGVYNTALLGDEYYLVIVNGSEILLTYNTKMFELQE